MTSHRKNILVGLTVLGAFVVLGWMIIQFGGRIGKLTGGASYPVYMVTPRANGLSEGAPVQYLGNPVGRVEAVRLNDSRNGFNVELRIDQNVNLPANVAASIRSINPISGAAAVLLEPVGPAEGSLREVAGAREIRAEVGGLSLVPDELTGAAEELRLAVREFREAGIVHNINRQVDEVGKLVASVNELVGDEALRGDVRESVTSIRQAAESAQRVGVQMEEFMTRLQAMQEDAADVLAEAKDVGSTMRRSAEHADEAIMATQKQIDAASRALLDRLEQMNGILANVQSITSAIDEGEGTAGMLLRDDRLYEGLVINMQLLERTIQTTNRLLEQWEQEGIRLRLFR